VKKLLCFHAGGQRFGAPIGAVKETLPERPLTRVFLVPEFVAGLMNLRGEVVAVLDLARLLALPKPDARADTYSASGTPVLRRGPSEPAVIILRSLDPGKSGRAACGLAVERLAGVRDVPDESLAPPPATLDPETAQYLSAVAADRGDDGTPRPILVLDPERVLRGERLKPFRRTRAA
jgi:chemotaxis-related protein WspB